MALSVLKSSRGFTLIELLAAVVILMVFNLGMLYSATVVLDHNTRNMMRDEAVRLASQKMNNLKGTQFDALSIPSWQCDPPVSRTLRNALVNYTVCAMTSSLSSTSKTIEVAAGWDYKGTGGSVPTGKRYQHDVVVVISKAGQ